MRILVACEESQAVAVAFRNLGHEAYSCDVQPCSGGKPDWHIQHDVLAVLDWGWDMIIAFPPCTHLASSGARWFAAKRADGRQQAALAFVAAIAAADCPRIAIENPIGVLSSQWRKPDQIVQPWQFGHTESKATCLWLKGLAPLEHTDNVHAAMMLLPLAERTRVHYMSPGPDRAKLRSKTYSGIAAAMAAQWGKD